MTQTLPVPKSHQIIKLIRHPITAAALTIAFILTPLNDLYPIKIQLSSHPIQRDCPPLAARPLRVGISHWAGFAGGILVNGGVEPRSDSAQRWEIPGGVEFVYLENAKSREQAFSGCADSQDHVDVLWTTIDSWAAQYPRLARNKNSLPYGMLPQAIMQVAQSNVACKLMAPSKFEGQLADVSFLKVGAPRFTPAHAIALRNVGGHWDRIITTDTPEKALDDLHNNEFFAIALCEPFLQKVHGILPDPKRIDESMQEKFILVARGEVIQRSPEVLTAFVKHWLDGNQDVNGNSSLAVDLLSRQRDGEPGVDLKKQLQDELSDAHISSREDNQATFKEYDAQFKEANQLWVQANLADAARPADSLTLKFIGGDSAPLARAEDCAKLKGAEGNPFRYILYFAPGSYAISDSDETWITNVSEILSNNPQAQVCITGHTDDTGSEKTNVTLSLDRANEVARYLKIDPARVFTFGKADLEPTDPALKDTREGRARDRRAVIEIVVGDAR